MASRGKKFSVSQHNSKGNNFLKPQSITSGSRRHRKRNSYLNKASSRNKHSPARHKIKHSNSGSSWDTDLQDSTINLTHSIQSSMPVSLTKKNLNDLISPFDTPKRAPLPIFAQSGPLISDRDKAKISHIQLTSLIEGSDMTTFSRKQSHNTEKSQKSRFSKTTEVASTRFVTKSSFEPLSNNTLYSHGFRQQGKPAKIFLAQTDEIEEFEYENTQLKNINKGLSSRDDSLEKGSRSRGDDRGLSNESKKSIFRRNIVKEEIKDNVKDDSNFQKVSSFQKKQSNESGQLTFIGRNLPKIPKTKQPKNKFMFTTSKALKATTSLQNEKSVISESDFNYNRNDTTGEDRENKQTLQKGGQKVKKKMRLQKHRTLNDIGPYTMPRTTSKNRFKRIRTTGKFQQHFDRAETRLAQSRSLKKGILKDRSKSIQKEELNYLQNSKVSFSKKRLVFTYNPRKSIRKKRGQ